ncbi:MAG: T9SS type A sorting domain-containing protein, partial [Flavobacteriales bacterium]|nr:T9SS type A sorting domain-containing protein [Flavobacteriales bacterium]
RPGQNLDGGSLVEAALDDVQLWDNVGDVGIDEQEQAIAAVFPDPADQLLNVRMDLPQARNITVRVTDLGGREVLRKAWGNLSGEQMRTLNVGGLANGSYVLQLLWEGGRSEARFQVVR